MSRKVLFIATAIVLTSIIAAQAPQAQKTTATQPNKPVAYSTDRPDESKTNANQYSWNGEADEPKKLRIPKLGVDAFVQKTGVDQNRQIAVPTNIHLAGWFADSQKPGQPGLSIIAGHVSGMQNDGVFRKLSHLSVGDSFEIEVGSGRALSYTVLGTVERNVEDAGSALFAQNPAITTNQVNLITCSGTYNQHTKTFDKRLIVTGGLQ